MVLQKTDKIQILLLVLVIILFLLKQNIMLNNILTILKEMIGKSLYLKNDFEQSFSQ